LPQGEGDMTEPLPGKFIAKGALFSGLMTGVILFAFMAVSDDEELRRLALAAALYAACFGFIVGAFVSFVIAAVRLRKKQKQ
jgi:hypothetical protein